MNRKPFLHNIGKGINILILFSLIFINSIPIGAQPVLAQSANPTFGVRANEDRIEGWEWPLDATVTIEIAGLTTPQPMTATVGVADWDETQTYFSLNLEDYDLKTGDVVTVTDETITKTHTVTSLAFTDINVDDDIVTGTATAGSQVDVWTCDNTNCYNIPTVTTNGSGTWVANFTGVYDIVPGTWIDSSQGDDDGDSTFWGQNVPNPYVEAAPYSDWIHAREWPLDTVITMEIDDPSDGIGENDSNPVDYSATATMEQAPWNPGDPNDIVADFRWPYQFVPGPGYVITMSGNEQSKTLTVSSLKMTDFDLDADTISGIATPDAQIQVCANVQDRCITRWVTADSSGNWIANYHDPGTGNDDPDTFDVQPGSNGWAAEYEDDSDRTWFDWNVADPRIEVSYEHDWIQIRDFTPGGDVTYTIFDHEGGHALFGPVTGPVDSHGEGWIDYNLHHTDLIPGNYIAAVNEATGEEVSILIRDLNLDYIGVEDDMAFGTAEPNTTIELYISQTHDDWFSLSVDVDGVGNWSVDLAAEGHPIDSYRQAGINLYDAEGDNIHAEPPRIHGEIRSDHFNVDNFSKNADVTLTLYDSPGGDVLYGPVTLRTDSSGNAWVNLWPYGIDLVSGNYIVAYDHHLDFTKSLEIEPFTFDGMNTAEDYVYGTSAVGEWVDLHVTSLFSNWGLEALTDETGHWTRDYGAEDYDITDQMWANGWAIDDQNNWSEDHTTGLPNIEASIADDWISGFNFSPDRQVRISFYDTEGGNLIKTFLVTAWGDTQFYANFWDHGVDLQAGMYLLVEDLETGKFSELTLVPLTFDGVDYDTNTAWGRANPGTQVVVRANQLFESHEITVIADGTGTWFADFSSEGADLTIDWDLRALVFDLEHDATVAEAPRPPELTASVDGDWVSGENWTPGQSVSISVYDSEGGSPIGTTTTWSTDNYGSFYAELGNQDIDLLPGYYIVVEDNYSGVIKTITLPNLTIDYIDPVNDIAGGQAPADTRLSVDFNNQQESIQFDLFSESNGTWEADFAAHDFDLQPGSRGNVRLTDEDGDATQVDGYVPNPNIRAITNEDRVDGWQWTAGATATLTIDDPSTPQNPDFSTQDQVGFDDERGLTYVNIGLGDYDLKPGDIVTLTDGTATKTVTATNVTVTSVDVNTNVVTGTAEPESQIWSAACQYGDCFQRTTTTDLDGNWSIDFDEDMPGQPNVDIVPGGSVDGEQFDDDGDSTLFTWGIPNPTFGVRVNYDGIEGWEWPLGATVTIEIDDPTTSEDPEPLTATVGIADWDPNQTYFSLNIENYDLKTGDSVTVTDGNTTKELTITHFEITGYDLDTEMVYGEAGENQYVNVWTCWQDDPCIGRDETADGTGHWETDFSVPGEQDWEHETTDLRVGSWIDSSVSDEDGDQILFGLNTAMANQPPVADANGPYTGNEGSAIGLDGTGSSDPDGNPLNYGWSVDSALCSFDDASSATPNITCTDNGNFTLTLTVDDGQATNSDTATVTVSNVAPIATFNAPTYVIAGDDFSLSLTDPYDPSSADTAAGFEYAFDCGDGGGYGAWSGAKTATCNTSSDEVGDRTVMAKIRDKNGGVTERTAIVTVLPPSAATDSALCYYDREPDIDGQQFRLIFTPDMQLWPAFKLPASNPGQFFYNVFYTGTGPVDFNITVPEPFEPQGANPVHVYTDVSVVEKGGFKCFKPVLESEIYTGDFSGLTNLSGPGGFLYIAVHLDYELKGTTGYIPNANNDALDADDEATVFIPNLHEYTFSVSGSQTDEQTIQNVNEFKKIPGFGGLVTDEDNPVEGTTVKIYLDGTLLSTATTDEDGWYMLVYKHKGKPIDYTVKLGDVEKSGELKANKFVEVNFP